MKNFKIGQRVKVRGRIEGEVRDYTSDSMCVLVKHADSDGDTVLYYYPDYDVKAISWNDPRVEGCR